MINTLITGGAGFIGSHVIKLFVKDKSYNVFNLDSLTYAGSLNNLEGLEKEENYTFIKGDICDKKVVSSLFKKHNFNYVINIAAESHVDRSIETPTLFAETNVLGTLNLLENFRRHYSQNKEKKVFYQISTDEVYGSIENGLFHEKSPYRPNSPYSASKASSDHFVRAYYNTYGLPTIISNCSNNYGPNQFPEKLIPLCIISIINNKEIPIYGDGNYTRDWLYVEDHAKSIKLILEKGKIGQTYNVGGNNEIDNIEIVHKIISIVDEKLSRPEGTSLRLIKHVKDRKGHDRRYAIDSSKIKKELKWKPTHTFQDGIKKTIDWYFDNEKWLKKITDKKNY